MSFVITIGRENGSGGKYIGEELAKKLNIKLYDKELLKKVADSNNIDINLLEETDEKQKKSFWYTMAMASMAITDSVNSLTELPTNEQFFLKTAKVIEELYDKESCIIIGRCANSILRNRRSILNVFIYSSDEDFKIKRKLKYANFMNKSDKEVAKIIRKNDKERASYYNYYTNGRWGDKKEYDLCIDTSRVGVDNAVDLIIECAKLKGIM